jgi:aerobic-type carbon monoxide dehydrogenase small subunit (CoxS/CutS family)
MNIETIRKKGIKELSHKLAVARRAFICIGETECDFINPGALLVQYNVLAKSHPKYKSTVAYMYKGGVS